MHFIPFIQNNFIESRDDLASLIEAKKIMASTKKYIAALFSCIKYAMRDLLSQLQVSPILQMTLMTTTKMRLKLGNYVLPSNAEKCRRQAFKFHITLN